MKGPKHIYNSTPHPPAPKQTSMNKEQKHEKTTSVHLRSLKPNNRPLKTVTTHQLCLAPTCILGIPSIDQYSKRPSMLQSIFGILPQNGQLHNSTLVVHRARAAHSARNSWISQEQSTRQSPPRLRVVSDWTVQPSGKVIFRKDASFCICS